MGNWKRLLTTALVVVAVGGGGCSTQNVEVGNVKSDAIYQIYQVTYHAEQDRAYTYARFRVGGRTGTNVDLGGRGSVVCNGEPLRDGVLFSAFGKYYEGSLPGFTGSYEFIFTDAEGKKFSNSVRPERIGVAATTPERLSRGRDHALRFERPPLGPREKIALQIDQRPPAEAAPGATAKDPFAEPKPPGGGPGSPPVVWVTTKTAGATEVAIRQSDLAVLRNGPARLRWVRTVEPVLLAASPVGGSFLATYLSAEREVTLEE